jgi:hypothetical protein
MQVIDLGYQPLADDLVKVSEFNRECIYYPIKINLCRKCQYLQNNYIVGDKILYNKNYHYRPGISKSVVDNLKMLAKETIRNYDLKSKDLVIDVGSNDGTLLSQFKYLGHSNLLGVEPTNTYVFHKKHNIDVINDYFNLQTSQKIYSKYKKAKIITTTNVFAHTNRLGDFINGLKKIIRKDGIFIVENHYLLDVIKRNQFDTFYHEHLRTYSLKSLIRLMKQYGFYVYTAKTSERYGGNIQVHFTLQKVRPDSNVNKILKTEKDFGLDSPKTYFRFNSNLERIKIELFEYLNKNKSKFIVGKAFPARASILIHYFSFLKDYLQFIAEQPTSLKLKHYIPGTSLEIKSSNLLLKNKPDIMVILAWHMFDVILEKWKQKGLNKTIFVSPLPKLIINK